jgi:hypothetical protein
MDELSLIVLLINKKSVEIYQTYWDEKAPIHGTNLLVTQSFSYMR